MNRNRNTCEDRAKPRAWRRHIGMACTIMTAVVTVTSSATAQPVPATRPGGGAATRGSRAVMTLDELFATLDKDRDGKISKEEAAGDYAQRFAQWDAKGEGFVTRQQIHDFRARLGIGDDGQRINGGAARQARAAATAKILKEPADWRLENFPIPPGFAPEIKVKGSEEARFAPGMYDTKSDTYFSYAVAITLDGALEFGAADLKDFLEKYFRGLSASRAQRSGGKPDVAKMDAVVTPVATPDGTNRFSAKMKFFDSFTDGREVTLNIEAQILPRAALKQTFVILLISPSAVESETWKTLREVGKKAAGNVP